MAVVGQATHVRCKVYVQMCIRSTLCSGDKHTTRIPTRKAGDKLGILLCSSTTHVTIAMTIVMRSHHTSATRLSAIDTLPMFTVRLEWKPRTCKTSLHAADSSRLPREYRISKSRSPYVVHNSCEHCSQIQQRVAPSSTCLSQSR